MDPEIHVNKNSSLADEAIDISITGLNKFQKVSLHASSKLANGAVFESTSHYIADNLGCIDLRSHKSYGGTYEGIWPMGPISFMTPSSFNKRKHERFLIKDPMKPFTIKLQVFDSFIPEMVENTNKYKKLTDFDIIRTYVTPQVIEQEIHEGKIRGTLYLPTKSGKYPGVISMSGGYPGAMKHKAAILASHGFVALALRYFGTDDLPPSVEGIDLAYFIEDARFLKNHPNVQGKNGVGIIANCAGAIFALAAATCAPDGLFGCVVAISGWFFSFTNFEYGGKKWKSMLSFKTFKPGPEGTYIYDFDKNVNPSMLSKLSLPDDSHFAFYKRLHTAYMFVHGGEDADLNNNSLKIESVTRDFLKSYNHPNYQFLFHPKAGHLIEHAYFPFARIVWTLKLPRFFGGQQPYHSIAQEDSWPKILKFVQTNLMKNCHKL
ncbi:bile acid-CoA:amino acid N-acyltransferase-like isoform X1 [Styela clava]